MIQQTTPIGWTVNTQFHSFSIHLCPTLASPCCSSSCSRNKFKLRILNVDDGKKTIQRKDNFKKLLHMTKQYSSVLDCGEKITCLQTFRQKFLSFAEFKAIHNQVHPTCQRTFRTYLQNNFSLTRHLFAFFTVVIHRWFVVAFHLANQHIFNKLYRIRSNFSQPKNFHI